MSQYYVRVHRNGKTTAEHASDDKPTAEKIFEDLKKMAPEGSVIDLRDFSLENSLIDSHLVKKVS